MFPKIEAAGLQKAVFLHAGKGPVTEPLKSLNMWP